MPGYLHALAARLNAVFQTSATAPRPPPEQRRKTPMTVLPTPKVAPTPATSPAEPKEVKVVFTS